MSEGGKEAIKAGDEVVAKAEILALQKQVRELQRILGAWARRRAVQPRSSYLKSEDTELLKPLRSLVDERPWLQLRLFGHVNLPATVMRSTTRNAEL